MPRSEPHPMFDSIRADEVAECFEGVTDELYTKLWNVIVPLQKKIPNLEDSGPFDHVGHENLASHWDQFTEDERTLLNFIADKNDPKDDATQAERLAYGRS